MSATITELDRWIAGQTRGAASAMSATIAATHLVKERPGFGQKVIPRPGSVLASPVIAAYDPDPDYFGIRRSSSTPCSALFSLSEKAVVHCTNAAPRRYRDLVMAMLVDRLIAPRSKLGFVRAVDEETANKPGCGLGDGQGKGTRNTKPTRRWIGSSPAKRGLRTPWRGDI
jgi:hypothetical protein